MVEFTEDGSPPPGKHKQARRLGIAAFWTAVALAGFVALCAVFIPEASTRLQEVAGILGTAFIGLFGIVGTYMGVTNMASQFK